MRTVDTLVEMSGTITTLAHALNVAMARDPEARARYAATYGAEWTTLCAPDGTDISADASDDVRALAVGTEPTTMVARKR